MSLAGCGPPTTHPLAPPSARAKANPKRSEFIGFLRLDRNHIRYRKCNNNQHQRYPQYIAQDAIFAGRAGSLRGLDDALVHGCLVGGARLTLGTGAAMLSIPCYSAGHGPAFVE